VIATAVIALLAAARSISALMFATVLLLALVAAGNVAAVAQAQIGGALSGISTQNGVAGPIAPQSPTPVGPITNTLPYTPSAPPPKKEPAAAVAVPADTAAEPAR
jgi:hypothetical protein